MTPAANPSIASIVAGGKRRPNTTVAAPMAVTTQVMHPARRAWRTGESPCNHSSIGRHGAGALSRLPYDGAYQLAFHAERHSENRLSHVYVGPGVLGDFGRE